MYHVQIMDGDIVRNLRDNLDHICHIHVAGVPTRGDLDDTQEINWRFVANAIADLGYTGYVATRRRDKRAQTQSRVSSKTSQSLTSEKRMND
jgi:hydroxypyruvate isomerase